MLPYTGDPRTLDQGNEWLQTCINNHTLCRKYSQRIQDTLGSAQFRPKRLVEVLPSRCRLHITQHGTYRYIALSHRWPLDGEALLRLTTDNMEEFKRLIPEQEGSGFSKVFSDAMDVCRHLGIYYIWIDSLCIIQEGDRGSDWKTESVRMSDIYQNAYCTISADSIEDSSLSLERGMFRERNVDLVQPIFCNTRFDQRVSYDAGPLTSRIQALRSKKPRPGSYVLLPGYEWASVASSPLFKRGWIVQERLLSQRILHFAKDQLYFTCCEMQASETWANGHPIFQISKPFRNTRILQDAILYSNGDIKAEDQNHKCKIALLHSYGVWYWIAQAYAPTELTRFTDKLVAISGVAKALQPYLSTTPEDYCAGLWRGSLPHALLWSAPLRGRKNLKLIRSQDNHPVGSAEWRAAYQAPSWSWASVNWNVFVAGPPIHNETNVVLADIIEVDVRPIQDRFGQVEPGSSITLRGFTYNVKLVWIKSLSNTSSAPKFWAEVRIGTGLFAKTWSEFVFPDERYIEGRTEDIDLRALPVLGSGVSSQVQWKEFLLLRPLQDGIFTRFGYLRLYGKQGHDFLEVMKKNTYGRKEPGRMEIVKIL